MSLLFEDFRKHFNLGSKENKNKAFTALRLSQTTIQNPFDYLRPQFSFEDILRMLWDSTTEETRKEVSQVVMPVRKKDC